MTGIATVSGRLRQANGLAAILDAAHDGFEGMLSALWDHIDPAEAMFIPLLMAATCAADGRDAVLFAPSLPPHPYHPTPATRTKPGPGSVDAVAAAVAGLCELLASRLADAAACAPDRDDQAACHDAARHAREIYHLLAGTSP
jgi:hypothetical protein